MALFGPPDVQKMKKTKDVDGLIKALSYQKDWQIRRDAASVLGQIRDERAVKALIEAMHDDKPDVNSAVAASLASLAPLSVEPLIEVLKGGEEAYYAVQTLGKIGDPRALDVLITLLENCDGTLYKAIFDAINHIGEPSIESLKTLLENDSDLIRSMAAKTLDKLGWKPDRSKVAATYYIAQKDWEKVAELGSPAVEPLIRALNDEDQKIRTSSVAALGKIGDVRAVEPLIRALDDKDTFVPGFAAEALGLIGDPAAVDPIIDRLDNLGYRGVEALGVIGDMRAVEPLGALLKADNRSTRTTVFQALGKIGGGRAVQLLVNSLGDGDWIVRDDTKKALANIGEPVVKPLIGELKNKNKDVRRAAIDVLGQIGDAAAVAPLITMLLEGASGVLDAVAEALGEVGGASAVEPLISVLKNNDQRVRRNAAKALGQIGDTRAVKPLLSIISDKECIVREQVADTLDELGWMPDKNDRGVWYYIAKNDWKKVSELGILAVEPLISRLHDGDNSVRRGAAQTLGEIGDIRCVKPLLAMLEDNDKKNRVTAAKALVSMHQGGSLNPALLKLILDARETIISHDDHVESKRISCFDSEHTHYDSGIGVDFPL